MNCITYFRLGDIRPGLCITEETQESPISGNMLFDFTPAALAIFFATS